MSPKNKKDWSPEPFPEPRTVPSGWDPSALRSTNGKSNSQESSHTQSDTQDDNGWQPEKFPKPRTYPKNWSVDD